MCLCACCLQVLPSKINSEQQAEILSLLCKVHELEIETMEMQSSCLLRNIEIRRKDMEIAKHWQHHNLCDEIIQQQKVLIEDNNLNQPKELEELYELYQLEVGQRPTSGDITLPALPPYKVSRTRSILGDITLFVLPPYKLCGVGQRSTSGISHYQLSLPTK